MSNAIKKPSVINELLSLEKPFKAQNAFDLRFESECLFAKQQILKNNLVLSTAENNPGSLRSAILNVAAIGISLNPALALAYLVPRDGCVCLDISYRGLVRLATDSGAIEWAKAVLVYEGDDFKWRGPSETPLHEADVFNADRIDAADPLKNLKGGYCIAKLPDGGVLVDVMTAGEIIAVKQSSKAGKGPWSGKWAGEMAKKTLVKRASKSWPQSNGRNRLDSAIEMLNQHEGIETESSVDMAEFLNHSPEQLETAKTLLNGNPVDFHLWYSGLDERIRISLYNAPKRGEGKGQWQKLIESVDAKGREVFQSTAADLWSLCQSGDEHGIKEILIDASDIEKTALVDSLPVEHANLILNLDLDAA